MQEEVERKSVSITVQTAKLSGRVMKAAIAALLRKIEKERTTPKVGRNSMKRLSGRDGGSNAIEVSGRIRSFERYARRHQVRYHIEKDISTSPPKWTVYFKANQADALTAAFKEYTRKDLMAIEKMQATLDAARGVNEKPSLTGALKENAAKVKEQPAKPAPTKDAQAR